MLNEKDLSLSDHDSSAEAGSKDSCSSGETLINEECFPQPSSSRSVNVTNSLSKDAESSINSLDEEDLLVPNRQERNSSSQAGSRYTDGDRSKIVKYIVDRGLRDQLSYSYKGIQKLWENIIKSKVIEGRTAGSVKQQFYLHILPKIEQFTTAKNAQLFRDRFGKQLPSPLEPNRKKFKPRGEKYNFNEDAKIAELLLCIGPKACLSGNEIWKKLEAEGQLERPWSSIRNRFLNYLSKNPEQYIINNELLKKFQKFLERFCMTTKTSVKTGRIQNVRKNSTKNMLRKRTLPLQSDIRKTYIPVRFPTRDPIRLKNTSDYFTTEGTSANKYQDKDKALTLKLGQGVDSYSTDEDMSEEGITNTSPRSSQSSGTTKSTTIATAMMEDCDDNEEVVGGSFKAADSLQSDRMTLSTNSDKTDPNTNDCDSVELSDDKGTETVIGGSYEAGIPSQGDKTAESADSDKPEHNNNDNEFSQSTYDIGTLITGDSSQDGRMNNSADSDWSQSTNDAKSVITESYQAKDSSQGEKTTESVDSCNEVASTVECECDESGSEISSIVDTAEDGHEEDAFFSVDLSSSDDLDDFVVPSDKYIIISPKHRWFGI